jgi:hypothetical protein
MLHYVTHRYASATYRGSHNQRNSTGPQQSELTLTLTNHKVVSGQGNTFFSQ